MFEKNVGGLDRIARIVLGVLILSVAIYYESLWGILGLIMLATGTFRSCPLYSPFKITTHREK
ncbi:MAG: DUF2892 domain-containing protein [Candidatus Moranbacteria bacterium]|nr:DUF2892 domain-containing protein [Candidatus Moranbacteria bacterium]